MGPIFEAGLYHSLEAFTNSISNLSGYLVHSASGDCRPLGPTRFY